MKIRKIFLNAGILTSGLVLLALLSFKNGFLPFGVKSPHASIPSCQILAQQAALRNMTLNSVTSSNMTSSNTNNTEGWSQTELNRICTLWIGTLRPLPTSPGNAVADHPVAASLGKQLFFDTAFSANQKISCATCHHPENAFTDGLKTSVGLGVTSFNAMPLNGVAYQTWFFWDGRKDSLWSQALGPWENPDEHGADRLGIVKIFIKNTFYRQQYQTVFGELPSAEIWAALPEHASPLTNEVQRQTWARLAPQQQLLINTLFSNLGKAIEAYLRQLPPASNHFDNYAEALLQHGRVDGVFDDHARAGLELFIGKAQCINCHNGPLFSNAEFHNTFVSSQPLAGRWGAIPTLESDEFNCLGGYSSARAEECVGLNFLNTGDRALGSFKTPSLRQLSKTAPYMHDGSLENLDAVLAHYNSASQKNKPPSFGHNELTQMPSLNAQEMADLKRFLLTL